MESMRHRYAAILAADVVHYSTLMEGDGEGTVLALRQCRGIFQRCVTEQGGREFGSVGDSLMAEFQSPAQALRAANCIHSGLESRLEPLLDGQRLQVRIGLHAGDVIVEGDDVFGDVVNTASRLQGFARSGGTAMSAVCHEQVRKEPGTAFRRLGKHFLKNIADPVQIYEVVRRERRINWRRLRLALRPYRAAIASVIGVLLAGAMIVAWLEARIEPGISETLTVPETATEPASAVTVPGDTSVEPPTEYGRAYQLFVEGRMLFHQRGPAITGAVTALQRAVQHDPEFADAWAYLGAAASVAWGYDTGLDAAQLEALTDEATLKALELDPNNGLALAVRGNLAVRSGELARAANYFEHALRNAPENSTVHLWAGVFYLTNGYLHNALLSFSRAQEIDPDQGIANSYLGMTLIALDEGESAGPFLDMAENQAFYHHAATRFNHLVYTGALDEALIYRHRLVSSIPAPNAAPIRRMVAEALRSGDTSEIERLDDAGAAIHELAGSWNMSLYLVLDLDDRFFEVWSETVRQNPYWNMTMRFFWLPGNRKYYEDPRFFAVMRETGTVALWETRGYPDGCVRVVDAVEEHLDCGGRFVASETPRSIETARPPH